MNKEKIKDFAIYSYIILLLLSFGFIITSTFYLPEFEDCDDNLNKDIKFCKRLNGTIFIFGIFFLFLNCLSLFTIIECIYISSLIIQWTLTLELMYKINDINCISEKFSIKTIFIILSCLLLISIIKLILKMIIEEKEKLTIFITITIIFEICFTNINFIYLPKKSSYQVELYNDRENTDINIEKELEDQLINSKRINQAILGFLILLIVSSLFKFIFFVYNKEQDNNKVYFFLNIFIIIQSTLLIMVWSMSLSILSKLNKIRKIEQYMYLTDDIRNNIIIVIIILSCFIILIIIEIIIIYFDTFKEYFSLLYKPKYIIIFIESVFNIIILILFPYERYYKQNYFYKICNEELLNNTYDISDIDIINLEKSYKVVRRINRTILSFLIIIFIIFFVKFIIYIYKNYKETSKDYISIFNCIIIILLFMNLFFGFILIAKINKIKIKEENNFILYKINTKLITKILKIMTLFSCYIIFIIFQFIIFYVCFKKEKIIYYTTIEYNNSQISSSLHQRRRNDITDTVIPKQIRVSPPKLPIPDFMNDITKILKEKIEDFLKTFIEEENKIKQKKEKFLKERDSKLENFLKNIGGGSNNKKDLKNKKNKDLTTFIRELNKEELEIEIDILINQVNKMHYIYKLIIDLIPKIKDMIIGSLKEKISSLPGASMLENKIKEISDFTPKQLIDSNFGKPLKIALEKYGISKTFLESFKNDLLEERKERRKNEIKKFFKNEFDDEEDNLNIDLFKYIEEEYSDEFFQNEIKNKIKEELLKQS